MTKKSRNNAVAAVIILLLIGGVIALAVLYPRLTSGTDTAVSVRMPLIVTTLAAADGTEHTVQSVFDVKMDKDDRRKIGTDALQEALTEIMSEMDYDAISAPDGIDYISKRATEELKTYFPDTVAEANVRVFDFIVSDKIRLSDTPSQQSDVMKGLFQNMD